MPVQAKKKSSTRATRDPQATRARILKAAKREFARLGLGGARVDTIADRAKANKRMIYHYFGGKEALFTAVLEDAYLDIRTAERKLNLGDLEPEEAMDKLVEFTWRYYLKNPEFLTLVNSENLHKAKHVRRSKVIREAFPPFVDMVQSIIDRGVKKGVFRSGVDAVQLNITIAAVSYYYLMNRHTGSVIYERDFMADDNLDARLQFNLETVRRMLRK